MWIVHISRHSRHVNALRVITSARQATGRAGAKLGHRGPRHWLLDSHHGAGGDDLRGGHRWL